MEIMKETRGFAAGVFCVRFAQSIYIVTNL